MQVSVTRDAETGTVVTFTRALDDTFPAAGPHPLVVGTQADATLGIHDIRAGAVVNLTRAALLSGDGDVVGPSLDDLPLSRIDKLRRAHAWLMGIGWGLLIPIGIVIMASGRNWVPIGRRAFAPSAGGRRELESSARERKYRFQGHRAINALGLIAATAGVIIAWTQFDSLEDDDIHRQLAVPIMILGWLQPVNAVLRPHAPDASKGEERSWARFVWMLAHRGLGYLLLALAIYNVHKGALLHMLLRLTAVECPVGEAYLAYPTCALCRCHQSCCVAPHAPDALYRPGQGAGFQCRGRQPVAGPVRGSHHRDCRRRRLAHPPQYLSELARTRPKAACCGCTWRRAGATGGSGRGPAAGQLRDWR